MKSLFHRFERDLWFPLKGGMRFGHKGGDAHADLGMDSLAFSPGRDPSGEVDDASYVLLLLGGKADHKVEFEVLPAHGEEFTYPLKEDGFVQLLINHLSEPFGCGLRRNGESCFLNPFHFPCEMAEDAFHS